MKQRIEHADPLELLRELPDGLAQMCIARLAGAQESTRALSVLAQAHRVLRTDGTLWLLVHRRNEQNATAGVRELGFVRLPAPEWASVLRGAPLRLFVFAKSGCCFFEQRLFIPHGPRPAAVATAIRASRRRATPAGECGHDRGGYRRLCKRCVLAGSAFVACGVCGAPYTPVRTKERRAGIRQPTCAHENPDGRCLVLDPFCDPASRTAEMTVATGRSFLGIVPAGRRP